MSGQSEDIFFCQEVERIRQEITLAGQSGIHDSEYIALLSKHNQELLLLLDKNFNQDETSIPLSELFKTYDRSIPQPICILDSEMSILFNNNYWEKQFGISDKNIQLKKLFPVKEFEILKEAFQKANRELKQVFKQIVTDNYVYSACILPFKSASSTISFLFLLFNCDSNKTGNLSVQGSNRNIESPGIYKVLLDVLDGFYFVLDRSMTIQMISRSVYEKIGFSPEELAGKSIRNLFAASDEKAMNYITDHLERSFTEIGSKSAIEIKIQDRKKCSCFYELILTEYSESFRESGLILGLCLDIHKRKEKESELNLARKKAEESDRLKSDFLANMSHEIRTPLNGIYGFSTMLDKNDLDNEKRGKYLQIIRSSTNQLLNLVNDIIDISIIEAGQFKIEYKKADIHQILDDLHMTYIEELQIKGKSLIQLNKSFADSHKKFFIRTDELRLKQILNNLLNNALKFTKEGDITLGYSINKYKDQIRFFVQDTGLGIPKSNQKLIFGRFRQTQEGEKNKYKGTGLGLAISKGIVELMRGKLEVVSQPGKGSEFFFTLPLNDPEA
jgi:PAS domain S-box-containing protein